MTTDTLFEQLQKNLADEVTAAAERAKVGPRSIRTGPGAKVQHVAEQLGISALSRLPFSRWWAVDDEEKLKFGAYAVAARGRGRLDDLFKAMAATSYPVSKKPGEYEFALPNWTQTWRPEPVDVPAWPTCPITKAPVRNPFEEPHDYKSQAMFKELSSRLAAFAEQAAKNHGVTLAMADELQAEKIQAETLRKLPYSEAEWRANRLRKDCGATVTEINLFARSCEDPNLLGAHRKESELGSPSAMFGHLGFRMALAKKDQKLADLHKAAQELYEQWKADEQQEKAA
jgi:hypothetical protein